MKHNLRPLRKPARRLGERLREFADQAWGRGNRELAQDLHNAARRAEKERAEYEEKPPSSS